MITEDRIREIVKEELELIAEKGFEKWLKELTKPGYVTPFRRWKKFFPRRTR